MCATFQAVEMWNFSVAEFKIILLQLLGYFHLRGINFAFVSDIVALDWSPRLRLPAFSSFCEWPFDRAADRYISPISANCTRETEFESWDNIMNMTLEFMGNNKQLHLIPSREERHQLIHSLYPRFMLRILLAYDVTFSTETPSVRPKALPLPEEAYCGSPLHYLRL
jgi:hypothetical protein